MNFKIWKKEKGSNVRNNTRWMYLCSKKMFNRTNGHVGVESDEKRSRAELQQLSASRDVEIRFIRASIIYEIYAHVS